MRLACFGRAQYFFGASAQTALSAYGAAFKANAHGLQFGAACFGFVCAIAWTLVNRGSTYWQENWERKADQAQSQIGLSVELFPPPDRQPEIVEGWTWRAKHFPVSGAVIAFSVFTILVWFGLIVAATPLPTFFHVYIYGYLNDILIFIVTLACAAAIIIFSSRSGRLDKLRRWLLRKGRLPP